MSANRHKSLADALDKIPDERIANVLLEGMSATVTSRAGTVEPDTRTRIQAANLIIQYKVGRPQISAGPPEDSPVNSGGDSLVDLLKDPALAAKMEEALAKAKQVTR